VGGHLSPHMPMKPILELVFQTRLSGLNGVGEEVKLYEVR